MTLFSSDTMKCLVVFLSLISIFIRGDQHLNANEPLENVSQLVMNQAHMHVIVDQTFLLQTLTIENINVSATVYSSNEQIVINWIPISNPCVDDFVGIYFVDIDPLNGK